MRSIDEIHYSSIIESPLFFFEIRRRTRLSFTVDGKKMVIVAHEIRNTCSEWLARDPS